MIRVFGRNPAGGVSCAPQYERRLSGKKAQGSAHRIERLATEKTAVTTDTALRLRKFFRTTPEFWMKLKAVYDPKIGQRL